MRIATYNVEWFANLFDDDNQLLLDEQPSARYKVSRKRQGEALAQVFNALDADAIVVIEAPNTGHSQNACHALTHFASWAGLRANAAIMGFANDTQQEIALLYDPAVLTARHRPLGDARVPRFDQAFAIDLDVDATPDEVRFSKPPMELELHHKASDQILRLIGVHLKSKAPHGARTDEEIHARSIANRRKQLAQAIWLRRRVASHLEADDRLIVAGDLNDGPGLDDYELLFGRSSVEIVMGQGEEAQLFDPHAQYLKNPRRSGQPTTARFYDRQNRRYFQALLDYVMVSPALRPVSRRWRIWHPFDDPTCFEDNELRAALLDGSDHFPVSLEIDLS